MHSSLLKLQFFAYLMKSNTSIAIYHTISLWNMKSISNVLRALTLHLLCDNTQQNVVRFVGIVIDDATTIIILIDPIH